MTIATDFNARLYRARRGLRSTRVDLDWTAHTVLPIAVAGQEHRLEARVYQGCERAAQALALINRGEAAASSDANAVPIVRVHSGCLTGDVFHSLRCDCYQQLQAALARIVAEPPGVLVYMPYHEGRGIGLFNKIRAYAEQDRGLDTVDANVAVGAPIEARNWDLAADVLRDLGLGAIRLLTNNPAKVEGLTEEGITVVERLPLVVPASPYNERYLETKRDRLGHELEGRGSRCHPNRAQVQEERLTIALERVLLDADGSNESSPIAATDR
jgi:GTP cyclohydrolase II/3,4-dihydroxy 2-butanone 4-phosphate synthase/GTP cyclohydrolase II